MRDTVDTAEPLSPAGQVEDPQDVSSLNGEGEPRGEEVQTGARRPGEAAASEQRAAETEEPEEARSLTDLFEELGRELSDLGKSEAQLEAARNMPEVRQSARDIAGALIVVLAALTAFAFLNVAALDGLSEVLATWVAALVLALVWTAIGGVLLLGLMGRARRWLAWLVIKEPPRKAVDELERERDAAAEAARRTLELLGPALAIQIALAAMPNADDVADEIVEAGDSVLDASDEVVAEITQELPGGGAVRQVWAVALMPGRVGIKVATTVLRRRKPAG
jgi:Putative Actinobacterial Holin-X, holin superfamily III